MSTEKAKEHHERPAGFGPGAALRKARTDLHLSAEEVAQQLHLSARQITALEGDDYANLPQSTYVRGYLRNYALLLGLSPEPILQAYASVQGDVQPRRQVLGSGVAGIEKEQQVKLAGYVVGAVVLTLVVMWWQGGARDRADRVPSGNTEAELAMPEPPALDMPASDPVPMPSPVAPVAIAPSAPVAPPAEATAPRPQAAPAPSPAPRPVTQPSAPPLVAAGESDDERRARLVLQAEEESWAEIRDARETRLLYETIPAGRVVSLEGVPPFSVFLGNVDGVRVEFEGEDYDASRHKRGATARFTLGTADIRP